MEDGMRTEGNEGTELRRPEQRTRNLEVLARMSLEALLYYMLVGAGSMREQTMST
jgi:hypothetical protein